MLKQAISVTTGRLLKRLFQAFVFKPKPEKRAIEKEAEKIRGEQG